MKEIQPPELNEFTLRSVPLRMFNGDQSCWGTAFILLYNSSHYLVTAWHNLSGRNFITKKTISCKGWLPTCIEVTVPLEIILDADRTFNIRRFKFNSDLYFDEQHTRPIWLVDSIKGSAFDIAVIPLGLFDDHYLIKDDFDRRELTALLSALNGRAEPADVPGHEGPFRISAHQSPSFRHKLEITDEVYVIGFPHALATGEGNHPIWKRGSVASEPELSLRGRPCFLIDTATRPGLSGAPVAARYVNPSWDDPDRGTLTLQGTRLGFCGLYTSRLISDAETAQLGVVWKAEALEEIIRTGVRGHSAFDYAALCAEGKDDPVI